LQHVIPIRPFSSEPLFSCETGSFRIVDKTRFSQVVSGKEEPWLTLSINDSNVMHSRPVRVASHQHSSIEIECENGSFKLDIGSESARKIDSSDKEWVYRGGLEANEGMGWIPVN
jgi:hypothetical protein